MCARAHELFYKLSAFAKTVLADLHPVSLLRF
jgi:hypothetical protein